MININLLPPELQRLARTPKALFFTLVGGVAATLLVGFGVFWLWISVRGLHGEVESRTSQVRALQAKASRVDRLHDDIEFYKDREKAIIEIKTRRTFWGLKLQQLMKLTPNDIWVTRLALNTLDEADYKWGKTEEQTGGELVLNCYARGTELQTLTNYRGMLSGEAKFYDSLLADTSAFPDNFFGNFLRLAMPEIERVDLPEYVEPRCLQSSIEIAMKPRFEKPVPAGKGK